MPIPIDLAVNAICEQAAEAISYYNVLSGMPPLSDMPEYFLPAFAAAHLGPSFTICLETNFTKLFYWDVENRATPPDNPMIELRAAYDMIGSSQVDLVLFDSDEKPKSEQGLLALVEFKLRRVSLEDRDKLRGILGRVRTCRYGVICSALEGTPAALASEKENAEAQKDRWFARQVPGLEPPITVCARVFEL